jgi:hypothetical protein
MRRRLAQKKIGILAFVLVSASVCGVVPGLAQASSEREIERFTCKDVMREPNTSREVAIAFLHGYLLGKSGTSKFDVDLLEAQTDSFVDQCLDHPAEKAVDVMVKLKSGK